MNNFSKLMLWILAIMCCNDNITVAERFDDHADENSIIQVDNNTHSVDIDTLTDTAVSGMTRAQSDLDANNIINIAIKSAIDNIDNFDLDAVNNTFLSYIRTEAIKTIDMLSVHHVNVHTNFYLGTEPSNLSGNPLKIYELSRELCENDFKTALVQCDANAASNILSYFLEKTDKKLNEMREILNKIKNMSQDKKNILKEYLLSDNNNFKYLLKNFYNLDNSLLNFLNTNTFANQGINAMKEVIRSIINNVHSFLKAGMECLKELDIDTENLG